MVDEYACDPCEILQYNRRIINYILNRETLKLETGIFTNTGKSPNETSVMSSRVHHPDSAAGRVLATDNQD